MDLLGIMKNAFLKLSIGIMSIAQLFKENRKIMAYDYFWFGVKIVTEEGKNCYCYGLLNIIAFIRAQLQDLKKAVYHFEGII